MSKLYIVLCLLIVFIATSIYFLKPSISNHVNTKVAIPPNWQMFSDTPNGVSFYHPTDYKSLGNQGGNYIFAFGPGTANIDYSDTNDTSMTDYVNSLHKSLTERSIDNSGRILDERDLEINGRNYHYLKFTRMEVGSYEEYLFSTETGKIMSIGFRGTYPSDNAIAEHVMQTVIY